MPPNGPREKLHRFVAIFFLSGVAGLAYQVIWAKTFAAAIGHEYPALLAVVSAFMCGMAAGNLILARFDFISPRCYGWLEIIIGIWPVFITFATPALETIVFHLLGLSPSPLHQWLVVFAVLFVVLFPATAAMGATLPAAERFLTSLVERSTTALLYGANTAGATLGAVLAAFWMMPAFGLRDSALILAGLNLFCGLAALGLTRNNSFGFGRERLSSAARDTASSGPLGTDGRGLPLGFRLFVTGLAGLGFEVAMVRGLSQILENTVYTFAVVLATYLAGTALGALLYHRAPHSRIFQNQAAPFLALALTSLLPAVALRWMPSLYFSLRFSLGDSLWAVAAAESLIALILLLLPCVCMGATWSWLAHASLRSRPNLAWAVSINTLGAALAPIVWGLALIPIAGLKGALAAVPLAYAALTIPGRTRPALISCIAVAAAIPFVTSNRALIDATGGRIISLQEGVMGSVAVIESTNNARVLKFNNRFQMGGTAARIAEQRQTDLPLLLHPDPRRALFIGLGTGISFATAADHPNLIADGVELVPEIARAMPLFNDSALQSTNLITHIADGRRFVRATTNLYDVIIADLFHPAQDGAGFLYTREHFQAIRERLTDSGLFCQWLPLHQIDLNTFEIIASTFESVFPDAQRWLLRFNIDTPVIGLIGNVRWLPTVERRMAEHPQLAEHLRSVGLTDSVRLFGCYLGESLFRSPGEVNTDAKPIVIFRAPAVTFQRADDPAERLIHLVESPSSRLLRFSRLPPDFSHAHLGETDLLAEIPKFILARNVYLHGLFREARGENPLREFIESARISSFFTAGYAQAIARATALARTDPPSAEAVLKALVDAQPDRPVARDLLNRLRKE
jgi:spermidine synthase